MYISFELPSTCFSYHLICSPFHCFFNQGAGPIRSLASAAKHGSSLPCGHHSARHRPGSSFQGPFHLPVRLARPKVADILIFHEKIMIKSGSCDHPSSGISVLHAAGSEASPSRLLPLAGSHRGGQRRRWAR